MELADEITIHAPLDKVYEGLNDIAILKACIPGCEALNWTGENDLEAKVTLKIGPVKAKFNGRVTLDTTNAPTGFSLTGEGDGGLAGFAKGGADVYLEEVEDGTKLTYEAKAEISGKLAQLGSRLVTSTAKKLSKTFFDNFETIMNPKPEDTSSEEQAS